MAVVSSSKINCSSEIRTSFIGAASRRLRWGLGRHGASTQPLTHFTTLWMTESHIHGRTQFYARSSFMEHLYLFPMQILFSSFFCLRQTRCYTRLFEIFCKCSCKRRSPTRTFIQSVRMMYGRLTLSMAQLESLSSSFPFLFAWLIEYSN